MKNKILFICIIIAFFSLYLFGSETLTAYESKLNNEINVDLADWKIDIDGQDIATSTKDIYLKNIKWDSTHTKEGKVAPGSKGEVRINIDPTKSEVAIKYNIKYYDKTLDEECILTVTSIYLEGEELQKEEDNSYSGIITLDQIKNNDKKELVINVEWVNDELNNEKDSQVGLNEVQASFLKLEFEASQYNGV